MCALFAVPQPRTGWENQDIRRSQKWKLAKPSPGIRLWTKDALGQSFELKLVIELPTLNHSPKRQRIHLIHRCRIPERRERRRAVQGNDLPMQRLHLSNPSIQIYRLSHVSRSVSQY